MDKQPNFTERVAEVIKIEERKYTVRCINGGITPSHTETVISFENQAAAEIVAMVNKVGEEYLAETEEVKSRNKVGCGEMAYEYLRGKSAGVKEFLRGLK